MEKLIIKNFGPVSDVEIELNKYVVFIGDTSTGKSVIAKLIAIFKEFLIDGISDIKEFQNKLKKYNIPFPISESTFIYSKEDSSIKIEDKKITKEKIFDSLARLEKDELTKFRENIQKINPELVEKSLEIFRLLSSMGANQKPLYIPAERIIYSMVKNSISGLWANNVNIAQCYKEFASIFENAREELKSFTYTPLNLEYYFNQSGEYIHFRDHKIPIDQTSSGIQSLIPLLVILNNVIKEKENFKISDINKNIIIEEPEISLFPARQKELVEFIINLFNDEPFDIIITTHSPYVISTINNLILASNASKENNNREDKINKIINKEMWIDYNEISVYEVKNGTVISLKDDEYKNIDINSIDQASSLISNQTDELIEIRYEN